MAQRLKVHYRPIEAAIRWSGLVRREQHILDVLNGKNIPGPADFPGWPSLRLNSERICDAIINNDLPHGKDGITSPVEVSIDDPQLTIRHVDLKSWMQRFYPEQKPAFLFDRLEREAQPAITIKLQIESSARELQALRTEAPLPRKSTRVPTKANTSEGHGLRNETTYLHIVAGLLTLLLGKSSTGKRYSSFQTQEDVINALLAHHGGRLGMTERTLQAKFAEAKRRISSE